MFTLKYYSEEFLFIHQLDPHIHSVYIALNPCAKFLSVPFSGTQKLRYVPK